MAALQRLKKQAPTDVWSVRERLCLASSVLRSGDQNWNSVSRAIKPFGEPNRPPDWFSPKNCALQYSDLLEKVETPKRKRREGGDIDTPGESIVRKLTLERVEDLRRLIVQQQQKHKKVKQELILVQSGQADDQLHRIWSEIQDEKRKQQLEAEKQQKWLEEREMANLAASAALRASKVAVAPKKVVSKRIASRLQAEHTTDSDACVDSSQDESPHVDSFGEESSSQDFAAPGAAVTLAGNPTCISSSATTSATSTPGVSTQPAVSAVVPVSPLSSSTSSANASNIAGSTMLSPTISTAHLSPLLNTLLRSSSSSHGTAQTTASSTPLLTSKDVSPRSQASTSPTISSLLAAPNMAGSLNTSVANLLSSALGGGNLDHHIHHHHHQHIEGAAHAPTARPPITSPSQGAPTLLKLLDMPLGVTGKLPPLPIVNSEEDIRHSLPPVVPTTPPSSSLNSSQSNINLTATGNTNAMVTSSPMAAVDLGLSLPVGMGEVAASPTSVDAVMAAQVEVVSRVSLADELPSFIEFVTEEELDIVGESTVETTALDESSDLLLDVGDVEEVVIGGSGNTSSLDLSLDVVGLSDQVVLGSSCALDEDSQLDALLTSAEKDSSAEMAEEEVAVATTVPSLPSPRILPAPGTVSVPVPVPGHHQPEEQVGTTSAAPDESHKAPSAPQMTGAGDAIKVEVVVTTHTLTDSLVQQAALLAGKEKLQVPITKDTETIASTTVTTVTTIKTEPSDTVTPATVESTPRPTAIKSEITTPPVVVPASQPPPAVPLVHQLPEQTTTPVTGNDRSTPPLPTIVTTTTTTSSSSSSSSTTLAATTTTAKVEASTSSENDSDAADSVQSSGGGGGGGDYVSSGAARGADHSGGRARSRRTRGRRGGRWMSGGGGRPSQPPSEEIALESSTEAVSLEEPPKRGSHRGGHDASTLGHTDTPRRASRGQVASTVTATTTTNTTTTTSTTSGWEPIRSTRSRRDERLEETLAVSSTSAVAERETEERLGRLRGDSRRGQQQQMTAGTPRTSHSTHPAVNVATQKPAAAAGPRQPPPPEVVTLSSNSREVDDLLDAFRDEMDDDKQDSADLLALASGRTESLPNSPASTSFSGDDPESVRDYKVWKKAIMLVWRSAANHKNANVFLHPVTEEMAPGYHSIVHRPMDLMTVKRHVETGVTRTTAEFQRDIMLMFQNAIMYNNSDHDVCLMAIEMQREVCGHIQDFLATQLIVQSSTAGASKPVRRETRGEQAHKTKTTSESSSVATPSSEKSASATPEPDNNKRKRLTSEGESASGKTKKRRTRADD